MLLTCREPRVLKFALFFRLYPPTPLRRAADVPAFPDAKKTAWLPLDERCVPVAQSDRWTVPDNRADASAVASGPLEAKAENGNVMGKC
jgi:hypothetical protein